MDNIKILSFTKNADKRGDLIPIEAYKDVPFNIERIFYIKNMDRSPRGFHAHKKTTQVLLPIIGSFCIELTDGTDIQRYELNNDDKGILIPHNIWLNMSNFSIDCIILVICSYRYDEWEYIRNFGDFIEYQNQTKPDIIKNMDLTKQTITLRNEIHQKISNIIDTNQFVLGTEVDNFENAFALYNNVKYCVGLSNGTAAMVCALKALDLKDNDEIIVQSNSYISAPLAIELCNLKIKIIDIDDTLNMDLNLLEESFTEKTRAVIVVHLYGTCVDMHELLKLKGKYNFMLIEDCAQAHGSMFDSKKLGTFGDIGCFSFYPTKNLGSFGEGGCIITNNEDYYNFIRKYRNYGCEEKYDWKIKGSNERLDNLQAAILNVKLPYLDTWNSKRNDLATIYNSELSGINGIKLLKQQPLLYRNYHLYVVLVDDREELLIFLQSENIYCAIHYPQTFYKSVAFKELNSLNFKADKIKTQILSLPLYPELAKKSILKVCSKIKYFLSLNA